MLKVSVLSFNPLDRGNLNQINNCLILSMNQAMFQSPRSGKFESNQRIEVAPIRIPDVNMFQSPRSGKFESNLVLTTSQQSAGMRPCFNPLDRGNLNQIKTPKR